MKNKLTLRLNKDTKKAVTPFTNKPEKGYIILEERTEDYSLGWLNEQVRSCIIKGKIELLEERIKKPFEGRIVIREYLESEIEDGEIIPLQIKKYLESDKNYESSIKRTAKDGVELTYQGELILRFSTWDPSGEIEDRFIEHDNDDEVSEWRSNK